MLKIYKASAGSGKTYTLVREYLRLAFASPHKYRHILAITFTNKAANEMKGRIIDALEGIAKGEEKYNHLATELSGLTNKSEETLRRDALTILRNILHNYADFSVSTIDSFVHRIVRAFTYDLHLPMSFEIEMDSAKLLSQAVELLLDRLSEADAQVTQAVVDFAEARIEEGKSWNIDYEIRSLGRELFVDDALPHIRKLSFVSFDEMREARASLYAMVNSFKQKLSTEGKVAYELILQNGLTAKDFYQGNKGIFGFFEKYASGQFPKDVRGNSYVLKAVEEGKWSAAKAGGNSAEPIVDALLASYNKITAIWSSGEKDYYLAQLLLKNFYSFILLADLQKLMDEIKREGNVLHISDFQHKVFEIVKDQDAPIVYERIGDRYDNILIDEFQDTSLIQWRNLLPLVENSQFKSEDSLIVGDGKQAIYRFRGGEVEQFSALPKIYGSEHDVILMGREIAINNYGAEVITLEKNYRSRKEIIDFNNTLFKELLELPELVNKAVYADYFQQQGRNADKGFVSIEFLEADPTDEQSLNDKRCQRVEAIVQDALKRNYNLRDVCILTRSNENASVIASYLIGKGIAVVSPESLLLHHSPKIRLLLAAFNYLDRKDDHIARVEMMHFIHLLQGKELKYELLNFKTDAATFEQLLSETTGLSFNHTTLPTGRLADLVQQLIRVFKLTDDDPFLQFFTDEVLLYAARYGNRINDFLAWWDGVKHKKSIVYPDSMNAVRVMTIHKSKGLQFPVVILADAAEKKKLNKKFFWVGLNKKWLPQLNIGILPVEKAVKETEFSALYEREDNLSFLDMLNLLYVGATRPEDALYILSVAMENEPAENNSVTALLVSFLKGIERWENFAATYTFGAADFSKMLDTKVTRAENAYIKEKTDWQEKPLPVQVKVNARLFWSETTVGKIEEGNLVHRALKQITKAGDEEIIVRNMCAEGLIKEEEMLPLLEKIKQVIYHTDMSAFFQADVWAFNERPLLKKDEKIRIPDRVIMKDGAATVIDYKTGKQDTKHIKQLNEYAQLLTEAGIPVARKIIFYLPEQKAEAVV